MKIFLASPHSYPGMIAEKIGGGTGETFIKQGDKASKKLFMAGGVSGNLKPFWKNTCEELQQGKLFTQAKEDAMKIFLAGGGVKALDSGRTSRKKKRNQEEEMRLFLAGGYPNGIIRGGVLRNNYGE